MNKVLTDPKHYNEIAKAIRAKGVEGSWTPAEMPAAIASIQGGGGSSGGDADIKLYNSAEEAYQDLRPAHWMKMVEVEWVKENTSFIEDNSVFSWVIMLVRANNNTAATQYYIPGTFSNQYIYHKIVNGNTKEIIDEGNSSASGGGNVYVSLKNLVLNPVDNMYEGIVCIAYKSSSSKDAVPYLSGSTSVNNNEIFRLAKDVDFYYLLPNGTTNLNTSSYAVGFGTRFLNAEFMRLRMPENRGYYKMGSGFWSTAGNKLKVVRECHLYPTSINFTISSPELVYVNCDSVDTSGIIYLNSSIQLEINHIPPSVSNGVAYSTALGQYYRIKHVKLNSLSESSMRLSFPSYQTWVLEYGDCPKIYYASGTNITLGNSSYTSTTCGPNPNVAWMLRKIVDKIESGEMKWYTTAGEVEVNNPIIYLYSTFGIPEEDLERYRNLGYTINVAT